MRRAAWRRGINVALAIINACVMVASALTSRPLVTLVAFVGLYVASALASDAHEECRRQRHTQQVRDRT